MAPRSTAAKPGSSASPAAVRPPLEKCTDEMLYADMQAHWRALQACASGGAKHRLFTPSWETLARGEFDSAAAKTFYLSKLLSYERAHQEDCTLPRCPHCAVSLPPTRQRAAVSRQRRWNDVWCRCGGCDAWMHKACASACHTVVDAGGAAFFCAPCFHGREGSATAAPLKCCDEDADDADNDSPFCVHFLPPFVSTARAFGGCAHRCFPEHDFDSYSSLMHQAKRVLQALSPELVARSLGFLPDEVDSVFKTVCVLTPAHAVDKVLAAMVLCGDAHKSAAQVLVAATHPEARQGGCMRALLLAASRHVAKASGIQALCLATARTDTRAATVWQRLGFRPVPSWPPGFVHRATSNDLGQVFVFSIGAGPAPVAPTLRLVAAPPASATVSAGAPPDWPGEVPFTSGAVPADAHPATMPKVHQPKVAIRRIDAEGHPCRGQWGLFARTPLQPCDCLLPYGGILRAACPSLSMHVVSAGGGLDVDAEHAGNEARYINHYAGIAELPNCRLEVRLDNTTGQRWLAVRLLHAVPAGRELVLDYGPQYAEKLRTPPAWLGRRGRDTKRVARAHGV